MRSFFRKLTTLALLLFLLACPALSESAEKPPEYPFPTELEGYTFVSFADNPQLIMEADLYDISLPFLVTAEYFEQVYPGCSLLQLKDFVISSGNDLKLMADMAKQAGTLPLPDGSRFRCLHFSHPFIKEDASFDVLVARSFPCVFFSDAPWMAHALAAWDAKSISYDAAVEITKRTFQNYVRETGWRMPDLDSLTYKGLFWDVPSEDIRLWEITVHQPQTPYDPGNEMSCLFTIHINADTGEPGAPYWTPETERDQFLEVIKKHTEKDPADPAAALSLPFSESSEVKNEAADTEAFDAGTKLYYNPDGGRYYHLDPCCPTVSPAYSPLQGWFLFSQVEDTAYRTLLPCKKCKAPKRE